MKNVLLTEIGRFSNLKNLHYLELKSNQGLHYLTSSLTLTDDTSKLKLIECIDKYIEDFKQENHYQPDLVQTDEKVKALRKFKKILLNNFGEKIIHGRNLASPDKSAFHKLEINSNLIQMKVYKERASRNSIEKNLKNDASVISQNFRGNSSNGFNMKLINSLNTTSTFFNLHNGKEKEHDLSFCNI